MIAIVASTDVEPIPAPPAPGPALVVEFEEEVKFALELAVIAADEVVVELEESVVIVEEERV